MPDLPPPLDDILPDPGTDMPLYLVTHISAVQAFDEEEAAEIALLNLFTRAEVGVLVDVTEIPDE